MKHVPKQILFMIVCFTTQYLQSEALTNLEPSTTQKGEHHVPIEYRSFESEIEKLFDDALAEAKTSEEVEVIEQLRADSVRAFYEKTTVVEHGADAVEFSTSVFDQLANKLYLGASSPDAKQAAIVGARINPADNRDLQIDPLTPKDVTLNKFSGSNNNPLYNTIINTIALAGPKAMRRIIVVTNDEPTKVAVITNPVQGSIVLQSNTIKDSNGDDAETIQSIAGTSESNPLVFAAISNNGNAWNEADDNNSNGIAFLKVSTNGILEQTDSNDVSDFTTPLAQEISFLASSNLVAFDSGGSLTHAILDQTISNSARMHWDDRLQRLFIALEKVQPNASATDGGIISLLIAGIAADGKTPFIKPIVEMPSTTIFNPANQEQTIIGCGITSDTNIASTQQVKTMHTSTGRDYVIVVGGTKATNSDAINSWVYALPIMPATSNFAGQLARTDGKNEFKLIDTINPLVTVDQTHVSPAFDPMTGSPFTASETRAVVGADPRFLDVTTQDSIHHLEVVGDSVYVSIAGQGGAESFTGIFQSAALFDGDGLIRGWTPWQKVSGLETRKLDPTGFGLNKNNGNFVFIGKDSNNGDKRTLISANAWGTVGDAFPASNDSVFSQIPGTFTENNGIYKTIGFDGRTHGFSKDAFSMNISVAGDRATLTQTSFGAMKPAQSIFTFNTQELKEIAPLTSATFINNDAANKGYVLFSGINGLVRLDQDATGAGIDTSKGIEDIKEIASNAVFKKIGDYKNILDIQKIATTGHSIIAGIEKAFVIQSADPAQPEAIVEAGKTPVPLTIEKPFIFDVQNSEFIAIAATTQGIFGINITDGSTINFPAVRGTPVQIKFLHDRRGGGDDGNVYVLCVDRDNNQGLIYRFDVDDTVVTPIDVEADGITPRPLKDLQRFVHLFTTDGTSTLVTRSQEVNSREMVHMLVNTNSTDDNLVLIDNELNYNTDNATKLFVGSPIRSSKPSGNWIIPGNAVRVNE